MHHEPKGCELLYLLRGELLAMEHEFVNMFQIKMKISIKSLDVWSLQTILTTHFNLAQLLRNS